MIKYSRILLKLSGESLMGNSSSAIEPQMVTSIINQIQEVIACGVQVAIVIGGGNFFRGVPASNELNLSRIKADHVGMLATAMNGILLQDFFSRSTPHIASELYSAFPIGTIVKAHNLNEVLYKLDHGYITIFVGGTGNPLFTTDTAAALRAVEINANLLIKATKVDGVYDRDPHKFTNAVKFESLSFDEAITRNLEVMDTSAFALCRDNKLDVQVCNIFKPKSLYKIIHGELEGTLLTAN